MKSVVRLEDGTKARQTDDKGQRERIYKDWHYKLGSHLPSSDVDTIEWRRRDGELTPVAVIEVTMAADDWYVNDTYLNSIIERYDTQMQGKATLHVAKALGVNAYITLFRSHLQEFWVYNYTTRKGWFKLGQAAYVEFLNRL